MAARPMFQAGGKELERLPGVAAPDVPMFTPGINPGAGGFPRRIRTNAPSVINRIPGAEALPNLTVVPRGGMDQAAARTAGITPIGKFAVILLLFALAVFFLPKGARGWFVLIIILGALTVNEGAIREFQSWALGR